MSQSIKSDRISESTIARMAGNLLSGSDVMDLGEEPFYDKARASYALRAVLLARAIAAEVERTPPVEGTDAESCDCQMVHNELRRLVTVLHSIACGDGDAQGLARNALLAAVEGTDASCTEKEQP